MGKYRAQIGDIVEVETSRGLAYVQYTFKHIDPPGYGELLRVLPGLFDVRPKDLTALASKQELYYTFYPLGVALKQKLLRIVANEKIPAQSQSIPLMRVAGWRDKNGKVLNWWVWDGKCTIPSGAAQVDLRMLSIAEVVNHKLFVDRLTYGWDPSKQA